MRKLRKRHRAQNRNQPPPVTTGVRPPPPPPKVAAAPAPVKAVAARPALRRKLTKADRQLFKAAKNGRTKDVKKWLRKGANINAAGSDGSTALMLAVRKGRVGTVKYLLNKGADPNLRNNKNQTALTLVRKSKPKKFRKRIARMIRRKGGKE